MLVSMKDILQHAHKHNYAVMAVNSINMEMARAVISAAEEEHSPIIVQMGPGPVSYTHLDVYKRQGLDCRRSLEIRHGGV